ncbi:JmjC-domain-containing protein [Gloeophyllum trabeum ATCC 11539]|uniref:[histone H3]-trimethyl-L-lysine(9) demethylase n=1 Tax=Gloeophyllum trabeum (strain ATCC 11539 / FP-39264 / Madison 617) TaxID=670483 RepID=S7Q0W2_GLOTA|nr:JmjC-domain-containing protein [Gloeophyllum trabeum ATCC 11539]EPQ53152.1 JmjC-domain-containing protein [Gloeophyllum trabeum ATCC 11539]
MSSHSGTPSLTPSPSRSPTPAPPPVQPDHFYGSDDVHLPPSPDSNGRTWLEPDDDEYASRGIPVFKPTMEDFEDFEAYMNKIECWGRRSGIVKVIPPKEWRDALPPITEQLSQVKLKNPIEQVMLGRGGLFRQQNVEKRRVMSVREWAELCNKDDYRAPGVDDVGLYHGQNASSKRTTRRGRGRKAASAKAETAEPEAEAEEVSIKEEPDQAVNGIDSPAKSLASPPNSDGDAASPPAADAVGVEEQDNPEPEPEGKEDAEGAAEDGLEEKPKAKRRTGQTRAQKEANLAERAAQDVAFFETFDPNSDWLPTNTTPFDFTPEFCQKLERHYWRNCGLGKPAWYGADMAGSLFTDETKSWNVAKLPSLLTRLLPPSSKGLLGVNTPYLYFGMWRATFAWHVEDMDLFSINYIHFGAPKFWYAIPQARAVSLENTMRGYFPKDTSQCPQFLRHKSFLASPTLLSQSSCRPNTLVQHAGEFVITYPRGYHAGFNLGFNCAESVNFALDSWLELGRKAKVCECINDSVRIDVDQLLMDRAAEAAETAKTKRKDQSKNPRKRKSDGGHDARKLKKPRSSKSTAQGGPSKAQGSGNASSSKVTVVLKLGPKPKEPTVFPCCLCVSTSAEGLLRVQDPPAGRSVEGGQAGQPWMAHESCASVIPETWVDEVEVDRLDGTKDKQRVVFGVDGIVKDRWNLKCSACSKARYKAHGAPIQCTKGRCPKAFHVSCARDGSEAGIVYTLLREVEKEVVLIDPSINAQPLQHPAVPSHVPSYPLADKASHLIQRPDAMQVDSSAMPQPCGAVAPVPPSEAAPRVLKIIKKTEVQCLCPQHNPDIAEAKKAAKMDKIRKDLLALPNMSRIKIRVSAGVFEVSLVRVIEESKSVEVLWDRGLKREFKWGSVVFGNTDGLTVGQKPTEAAPEPEKPTASSSTHVLSFSTKAAASSAVSAPSQPPQQQATATAPHPTQHSFHSYPSQQPAYNYWNYPYGRMPQQSSYYAPQGYPAYPYSGYAHGYGAQPYGSIPYQAYDRGYVAHPPAPAGAPIPPPAPYASQRQMSLQWKQPYVGPPRSGANTPSSGNNVGPPSHSGPPAAVPSALPAPEAAPAPSS